MSNTNKKLKTIDTFCMLLKEQLLNDLLSQCSEKQQTFFSRLYPNGVNEDTIENAIQLCERTIEKNNKG